MNIKLARTTIPPALARLPVADSVLLKNIRNRADLSRHTTQATQNHHYRPLFPPRLLRDQQPIIITSEPFQIGQYFPNDQSSSRIHLEIGLLFKPYHNNEQTPLAVFQWMYDLIVASNTSPFCFFERLSTTTAEVTYGIFQLAQRYPAILGEQPPRYLAFWDHQPRRSWHNQVDVGAVQLSDVVRPGSTALPLPNFPSNQISAKICAVLWNYRVVAEK